jgi:hypothetical protein
MNKEIILCHRDQLDSIAMTLREAVEEGEHEVIIRKRKTKRTLTQNKALHKYLEIVSIKMNDAGYTQRKLIGTFKAGFELPVTPHMLKDIFREVGRAMYKKESTADLDTKEISKVYKIVDQRLAEVTGISVPWPTNNPPIYEGIG